MATLSPEEQKEIEDYEAKGALTDEEKGSVRREYLDAYNKILKDKFRPTAINPLPSERQNKEFTAAATAVVSKARLADVGEGPARGPLDKLKSIFSNEPARTAPLNPISAAQQLRVMEGAPETGMELPDTVALRLAMNKKDPTPKNLADVENRKTSLKDYLTRQKKFSPENITRALRPPVAAPEVPEVPPEVPEQAVEEPVKEKNPIAKIEAKLSPFEEYKKKLGLTPTETTAFAEKETKLTDRLDTARKEYREGNRTTEFMLMLDKLAEAATLIGAGLYGKKHGVDAVSGLKFNPINWETRIKRLDKELDLEEKSYTKASGVLEKDKESMLAEKKAAVTFDEASVQAAQKMLAANIAAGTRKEEKNSAEAGRQSDKQVRRIESAINDIEKVRGMADDKMQSAAEALAVTLKIPESDLLKKGFWGGSSFNATVAKEALGSLQKKLVAQKDEILSGVRGAAPPSGLSAVDEARRQELTIKKAGR